MKKLFLFAGALFLMSSFSNAEAKQTVSQEEEMHCVISSCMGVFCNEKFKDQKVAIDFLDKVEDACDMLN
ncbi:Uncharacterised protein [Porphyromonas cangingivalis]|uniref:hypothetical protein n=1 Tax=Porphyromonas cangingivalis TaxID=36874 RepID=UPI00051DE81A|nr:hypothetical protein [Porphyromonas cangingivalis]KGL48256.1 hypothetical protein HQ34_07105 [Porphyromonas cangingivalis]SPY35631.1 Uncharacterised protein [Porphyromonas cangingivalis]